MSCGTPVISSSIGGIPEIIEHSKNGFLVTRTQNRSEFQETLLQYFNLDSAIRSTLSKNARETILKSYDLNQMVQAYRKLYFED